MIGLIFGYPFQETNQMQVDADLERTHLAEELRLLEEILEAVASSANLGDVIQTVGYGIKNVLPSQRWKTVSLALLDDRGLALDLYQIHGQPTSSYWSNVRKGALTAGRDLGVEVEFLAGGAAAQAEILEQGIRQQRHGIAVAPIDAAGLEPLICRARQAGIPVITYDTTPVADSQSLVYIGTDNVAAGRLAGDVMLRLLPEGGLVAASADSLQANNGRQRLQGFSEAVSGTLITMLPPFDDGYDAALGELRAAALLSQHPQLAGSFGACGANAPAWGKAIKAAGRANQVKLVGFDVGADTIALLKAGTLQAIIAQREYDMGYRSVLTLCQLITGDVESTLARLPASRVVDTGVDVVTLGRTSWSIALDNYIARASASNLREPATRQAVAHFGQPVKVLMIGMADQSETDTAQQRLRLHPESLIAEIIATQQSTIIDPFAPDAAQYADAVIARQKNVQTLVGVPLIGGGRVLGALSLESEIAEACTSADLAVLERIARSVSVIIANALLFGQLAERTRELQTAYEHQELLLRTISELSSPVAPITSGILVMPLLGAIDSNRTGRIMETLLSEISARQAQVVLIDITGVPVVDTHVANHLLLAAQAVRLLGAEVVLVGITPVVAQTIVALNVNLDGLTTRADLESGFTYALSRMKRRIV
jgi:ABC-type sugar transport system substrate-binding protein/anti-anti-sigma regulatory factor